MTQKIQGEKISFSTLYELWSFIHYNEGKAYYRNGDDQLTLCTAIKTDGEQKVMFDCNEVSESDLDMVVGFVDSKTKFKHLRPETFEVRGQKFLLLPDDSAVALFFVGEIPIYWLTDKNALLVDSPKTIYGGCPHRFGIKIG